MPFYFFSKVDFFDFDTFTHFESSKLDHFGICLLQKRADFDIGVFYESLLNKTDLSEELAITQILVLAGIVQMSIVLPVLLIDPKQTRRVLPE